MAVNQIVAELQKIKVLLQHGCQGEYLICYRMRFSKVLDDGKVMPVLTI